MRAAIRIGLLVIGLGLALLALNSCMQSTVTLVVTATPNAGHPPFTTTIKAVASKEGGTYTLTEEGKLPVPSSEGVFVTRVEDWPYKATVTWTDGNSVAHATAHVRLIDQPPMIRRPWMSGTRGIPFWRTVIDLRYDGRDHMHYGPCITDSEGDAWKVTLITVQCDGKDEPDTLFYPSIYGIEEFHIDANSGCDTIDVYPAAVWYPGYTAEIDSITGLLFSLSQEDGQSGDGDRGYPVLDDFTSPLFRAQNATITIMVEDEFGESTTESFIVPIIAYSG